MEFAFGLFSYKRYNLQSYLMIRFLPAKLGLPEIDLKSFSLEDGGSLKLKPSKSFMILYRSGFRIPSLFRVSMSVVWLFGHNL